MYNAAVDTGRAGSPAAGRWGLVESKALAGRQRKSTARLGHQTSCGSLAAAFDPNKWAERPVLEPKNQSNCLAAVRRENG